MSNYDLGWIWCALDWQFFIQETLQFLFLILCYVGSNIIMILRGQKGAHHISKSKSSLELNLQSLDHMASFFFIFSWLDGDMYHITSQSYILSFKNIDNIYGL
ncbi:hypothetical protein ACJX0J_030477 [Zea mays]